MSLLLTFLFALGFGLVPALALFILHKNPVSPLHRTFGWACLSLLAWLGTLYVFDRLGENAPLTFVGRLNYASVLFVVLLAYLFLRQVLRRPARNVPVLLGETLLLAAVTLLTPLVDRMEQGGAGTSRASARCSSSTRCTCWATWARPSTTRSTQAATRLSRCGASLPSWGREFC